MLKKRMISAALAVMLVLFVTFQLPVCIHAATTSLPVQTSEHYSRICAEQYWWVGSFIGSTYITINYTGFTMSADYEDVLFWIREQENGLQMTRLHRYHDGKIYNAYEENIENSILNRVKGCAEYKKSDGFVDGPVDTTTFLAFDSNNPDAVYDSYTNMMIFASDAGALAYFHDGDISGLLNANSVLSHYDSDIESPKTLKLTSTTSVSSWLTGFDNQLNWADGSEKFFLEWWQTLNDVYTTEVYLEAEFTGVTSDWLGILIGNKTKERVNFSTNKVFRLSEFAKVYNKISFDIKEFYKYIVFDYASDYRDFKMVNFNIYVRNVDASGNWGNWIKLAVIENGKDNMAHTGTITFNGSEYGLGKGFTEIDGSDSESPVENSEYKDTYKPYEKDSVDDNSGGILGFIQSGFGLFGDNGLFAFLQKTFSFLPAPIVTLIGMGTSLVFLVIIYKLIRG